MYDVWVITTTEGVVEIISLIVTQYYAQQFNEKNTHIHTVTITYLILQSGLEKY